MIGQSLRELPFSTVLDFSFNVLFNLFVIVYRTQVNLESTNALLKMQHEGLIEAFEKKDFLLAESEEKIYDLKRKVQRMEEQLQQETERNVENELKLQENEEESAELDRKCNGLFRQVEFINVQLQQSEERMSLLRLEIADLHNQLEDSETEIHTMTMSVSIMFIIIILLVSLKRHEQNIYTEKTLVTKT